MLSRLHKILFIKPICIARLCLVMQRRPDDTPFYTLRSRAFAKALMRYTRPNTTSSGLLDIGERYSRLEYAKKLLKTLDGLDLDIEVLKVNAPLGYIHMVIIIPPRVTVAEVMRSPRSRRQEATSTQSPEV